MKVMIKKMESGNLLSSLIICLIGLILMFFPTTTLNVVSYVIGSILLTAGILKVVYNYMKKKDTLDTSSGIILIILGVVVYVFGSDIVGIIRILIGIFLIYNGVAKLLLSLQLSKLNDSLSRVSIFLSSLLLLSGIVVLFFIDEIVFVVGLILVIYSIVNIIQNFIYSRGVSKLYKDEKNDVVIIEEEDNV